MFVAIAVISYLLHSLFASKANRAEARRDAWEEAETVIKHLAPTLPFTSGFLPTSPCWMAIQQKGVDESYDASGYHISFKKTAIASCPWTSKYALQCPYSIELRAGFEDASGPGAIKVYFNDVGDQNYASFLLLNNGTAIISRIENGGEAFVHTVENAAASASDARVTIRQNAESLDVLVDGKPIAEGLAIRLPHEEIGIAIGGLASAGKGSKKPTKIAFKSFTLNKL